VKTFKLLSIFFLSVILSYSQEIPTGFQDIDFGTTYDIVLKELIDLFHLNHTSDLSREYKGDYYVMLFDKEINIIDFKLGNKTVDLSLYFNNNLKFYKFAFDCNRYTANYFDTKVKKDAQFLSELFEKKYGPPKYKYSPDFFDVKEGYYSFYWKWWRQKHTVFTAISTYESEYYASAVVYDDILDKEQKIEEEKNKKESIEKAIDAF